MKGLGLLVRLLALCRRSRRRRGLLTRPRLLWTSGCRIGGLCFGRSRLRRRAGVGGFWPIGGLLSGCRRSLGVGLERESGLGGEGGRTVWVDYGEDVEVVFVEDCLDGGVCWVPKVESYELLGDVLDDLIDAREECEAMYSKILTIVEIHSLP